MPLVPQISDEWHIVLYPKNHPYYIDVPRAEINRAMVYLPPKNTFIDYDFIKVGTPIEEFNQKYDNQKRKKAA